MKSTSKNPTGMLIGFCAAALVVIAVGVWYIAAMMNDSENARQQDKKAEAERPAMEAAATKKAEAESQRKRYQEITDRGFAEEGTLEAKRNLEKRAAEKRAAAGE